MSKDEKPRDFDWVTARHECSPVKFFERLRLGAERNTETRNNLRTSVEWQEGLKFGYDDNGEVFSVFREGGPGRIVRFRLRGDTIHVEATGMLGGPGLNFLGTLTLTNEAKCRLKVGDEDLDEWQALRKALERLFFPG